MMRFTKTLTVLAVLALAASGAQGAPQTLFDLGSSWSWLHPTGGAGADPVTTDPDFNDATGGWFANAANFAANYNGPAFMAPAPALFGYGAIDLGGIATDIGDPGSGSRYTAYFRRDFTLPSAGQWTLTADMLADDGAIIYIDGVERARLNMGAAVEGFQTFAPAVGVENALTNGVQFNSGAPINLTAGNHTIAVSVHNQSRTSSDLGFDLRLIGDSVVAPADFGLIGPQSQNFTDAALLNMQTLARTSGGAAMAFSSDGTSANLGVKDSASGIADLTVAAQGGVFVSNGVNHTFTTDRIDLRDASYATPRTGATISFDIRTGDTSAGFEADDQYRFVAQQTLDGFAFTDIAGTEIILAQADLTALDTGPGVETFSNRTINVPDVNGAIRLAMIRTGSASGNEYLFLDNISITPLGGGGVTDPIAVTTNPNPPGPVAAGGTIQVSNAAAGANPRDAAQLANLAITQGANGTFSQNGLANGSIAAGSSQTGTIAFNGAGLLNGLAATATLSFDIQSGPNGAGTGAGNKSYNLTATVTGNQGAQAAAIAAGGSYNGLSGNSNQALDTTASLAGSNNAGGGTNVSMSWRARAANEIAPNGTSPPLPTTFSTLASDVLDLQGTAGDLFFLQLNYNEGQLNGSESALAAAGNLYLASRVGPGDTGNWVNAISLNTGVNTGLTNVQGAFDGVLVLGKWGVDTGANTVWAVLDHNSMFAALSAVPIPEPSSVVLAGMGLIGLAWAIRRRRG